MRRARLDAKLSQAQLAAGVVTRQAIHLIEKGKARPSARTLELIAERTGKPISYFLPTGARSAGAESEARRVQALCLERRFTDAEALAREILHRRPPAAVADEVRYWLGQALVSLVRPDEAVDHLAAARRAAERDRDPWRVAECLDWEAGALYLKEDPGALAVAETALARCRELEPRPPGLEARILEHMASIHARNRTFDSAVAYYEAALQVAGGMRDLARMARTYHGMSMAYQERGHLERAAGYAERALALYSLENDQALVARAENELGLVLMRQGRETQAEELFRSALGHLEASGIQHMRSHVVLSLAELDLGRGRLGDARTATEQALALAAGAGERQAVGTAHLLLGRVLAAEGEAARALTEFEMAVAQFEELGQDQRQAEAHGECARACEALGDAVGAGRQWRRAAELALPGLRRAATA